MTKRGRPRRPCACALSWAGPQMQDYLPLHARMALANPASTLEPCETSWLCRQTRTHSLMSPPESVRKTSLSAECRSWVSEASTQISKPGKEPQQAACEAVKNEAQGTVKTPGCWRTRNVRCPLRKAAHSEYSQPKRGCEGCNQQDHQGEALKPFGAHVTTESQDLVCPAGFSLALI